MVLYFLSVGSLESARLNANVFTPGPIPVSAFVTRKRPAAQARACVDGTAQHTRAYTHGTTHTL